MSSRLLLQCVLMSQALPPACTVIGVKSDATPELWDCLAPTAGPLGRQIVGFTRKRNALLHGLSLILSLSVAGRRPRLTLRSLCRPLLPVDPHLSRTPSLAVNMNGRRRLQAMFHRNTLPHSRLRTLTFSIAYPFLTRHTIGMPTRTWRSAW